MSNYSSKLGAIILSGGKSRRMGKPKSELLVGQKTLLQHIVQVLQLAVGHLVIVRAPDQEVPFDDTNIIWANDAVGDQGPLRGVQAGLLALPQDVEWVFLSACDVPLLKLELVTHLFFYAKNTQAVVPVIAGVPQPLTAVYATEVLSVVTELLAAGERSVQALLRNIDVHFVPEDIVKQVDPFLISFENANTPEDYQHILKIFEDMT
jgi:molybdenum cofactor guanylyltransferase